MPTVFITEKDNTLRKKGERLVVSKFDSKVADIPFIKVNQVVVFSNVTLTTPLIDSFLENDIPLTFLSYNGKFRGKLMPEFSKNSILRKSQYKASENFEERINLARKFVIGKLQNLRRILLRGTRSYRSKESKNTISQIKMLINKSKKAKDLDELRGYEGIGSRKYFNIFGQLLNNKFEFEKRSRRPPRDEVNALLSFGYMMMYNEVFNLVNIVGFDPYIGYLHHDKYGKPGLVLDLLEEFRAIIDNLVKRLFNRKVIKRKHFKEKYGSYELTEKGLEKFVKKFEEKMLSEFKHPHYEKKVDMREAVELQARVLGKKLTGEVDKYIPFEVK